MSSRKNRERAKAGNLVRQEHSPRMCKVYVCAYCHAGSGTIVKVEEYYFHPDCPKQVVPFRTSKAKE